MGFSEELKSYVNQNWKQCPPPLGKRQEELNETLLSCNEEEALLLRFLYLTLPLSDLGDYAPGFFLREVFHSLRLRETLPHCRELPEHLFLLYVLCPRVNTEELRPCREQFYGALEKRLEGLSLEKRILEVNLWCAEQATYRSTDDRTASPMAVFECGFGRCGEESAFAVAALRSVGVAARQVYAPYWSHCDDNHAWVEAYDGEKWRFFGACEPEPVLDLGWFLHAASRAMLEHARAFVREGDFHFLFPDTPEKLLWRNQGVVYETVTGRYGDPRPLTVRIKTPEGAPASGAQVCFQVLNMAKFSPIAQLTAGADGRVSLYLGAGSVLVSAELAGEWGEVLLGPKRERECELVLRGSAFSKGEWESFSFLAPPDLIKPGIPRPAGRKELLERAARLRESRVREAPSPAGERERRAFSCLSEKDRSASLAKGVLEDAIDAFRWEQELPKEAFETGLLPERIGLEPLFPWRGEALSALPDGEQRSFRQEPERLWQWVRAQLREEEETYLQLPASVRGVLNRSAAPRGQLGAAFVAFCRALGIPARLSEKDLTPEYYQAGAFHRLGGAESAVLSVKLPVDRPALYGQNWSLARRHNGEFRELRSLFPPEDGEREVSLLPGEYRLITCARKPDGNQFVKLIDFTLNPGERREIFLSFPELRVKDLLEDLPFPPVRLTSFHKLGEFTCPEEGLKGGPSLALWLKPGREPTEHVLSELIAHEKAVKAAGLSLHFILAEESGAPILEKARKAFPEASFWKGDFSSDREALGRMLYLDPEQLPFVLLSDRRLRVRYSCCGYSVGTIELVLRLSSLEEFSA